MSQLPKQPWTQDASLSGDDDADQRLTRSGAPDVRGDYSARQDAERADLVNMSDAEYEALIMAEYETSGVANPPDIPGYHLCWLSSTSPMDTIQRRQRTGYTPVMRSEMPGFDPSAGQALANFEGMITCNELVLHKIPMRRYQIMMNVFHHKKPLESEQSILAHIAAGNAERDNTGGEVADGLTTLERSVKAAARLPDQQFL
jgi:hypothetical protein